MDENNDFEYVTVLVEGRPRQQIKQLKKLAKEGWQVLSVKPATMFSRLSVASNALLRRVRN
jgi:hypothetical protein